MNDTQSLPPEHEGELVTFFTQQDRMHGTVPLAQWLFGEIERQGIEGATLTGALLGRGHDGVTHAITLFDVAEQPVQVAVVAPRADVERLLAGLAGQGLKLFYTRMPVRFGTL